MAGKKQTSLLAYLITVVIGLIFGTGAIWQIFNIELAKETLQFEKQKLEFEKQKESVNLRSRLNETMDKIVKLNNEFNTVLYKVSNSDTMRREYDTRYHLLQENIEWTVQCLAAIEGRPVMHYSLPPPVIRISPSRPKGVGISRESLTPLDSFLTIRLTMFISIFIAYTILIILLTIYIPKITKKIFTLIQKRSA